MTTIYGIKNCDTMKKAFNWLDENNIDYTFHDYKKEEPDINILGQAIATHGWDTVINTRGTTWRKLDDETKDSMDADCVIDIALQNPSILKRPLLLHEGDTYIGFKADSYENIFK